MPFYSPSYWLPQCNTSWSEKLARYTSDAAAVASNLTTLQRAGVQVVWFSLFARDKTTHGGPDVVRSMADHVVHKQLRIAGFFGAGGRLVDQWPLYASYFGLVDSRPARATFGPSSLHYSASSFADRFVLPDLGAMRVQFALDALCSTSAWVPPCGLGGDNTEQVNKPNESVLSNSRMVTRAARRGASTLHSSAMYSPDPSPILRT